MKRIFETHHRLWILAFLLYLVLHSTTVQAQNQTALEPPQKDEAEVIEGGTEQKTESSTEPTVRSDADIVELRNKIAKQEEVIEQMSQKVETLSKRLDESEDADLELLAGGIDQFEPSFNIHGFFDFNLYISDIPESPEKNVAPDDLSFVVNRLNLYFSSEMTRSLSALVEVRFTFLPLGSDVTYEEMVMTQTQYQRIDTTVMDPFTTEDIALGGLLIERVHLTWKPVDAFGIIAGRFLTPYGIWNVEHGSPVRIPILSPYFMIREFIPAAQTGLQLFGRVFPYENTYLDYALTVSNNRGPAESVYDISDNKAFGLRLKGSYEAENFSTSLGGYLYYGTVKDIKKIITDFYPRFRMGIDELYEYEELTGSLDLLIQLFDARLQVELVKGIVAYSERHARQIPIYEIPSFTGYYQPDYQRLGIYVLLGYEIFFSLGQDRASLMPYVNFEYNEPDDTFQSFNEYMVRGGLNFKPSPFVTLKGEVLHGVLPDPLTDLDKAWSYQTYSTQMAVSF